MKIKDLQPGTSYSFTIRARNAIGNSPSTSALNVNTPAVVPSKPLPPTITETTFTSITVSWIVPANGGSPLTAHVLELSSNDGVSWTEIYRGLSTSFTAQSLVEGITYLFRVSSINNVGQSEWSDASPGIVTSANSTRKLFLIFFPIFLNVFSKAPGQISSFIFTNKNSTAIELSWNAPANGGSQITGYVLQRSSDSFTFTEIYSGITLGFIDTGLTRYTTYFYRIAARNSIGLGNYSSILNITTDPTVPSTPGQPTFVSSTSNSISMQWTPVTDNGGLPVQYSLERGDQLRSNFGIVYAGPSTQHTEISLSAGTYSFRVRASNSYGFSLYSEISLFSTDGYFGPSIGTNEFPSSTRLLNNTLELYWKINGSEITMGIVSSDLGWVGFGIGSSMTNSDMIVGSISSQGVLLIDDYFSLASGEVPALDTTRSGTNDILISNGEEFNGKTTLKWKRLLNTGDSNDLPILGSPIEPDVKTDIIVAFHSSDTFDVVNAHDINRRATYSIPFFQLGELCIPDCGSLGSCVNGACVCVQNSIIDPSTGRCTCSPGFSGPNCAGIKQKIILSVLNF